MKICRKANTTIDQCTGVDSTGKDFLEIVTLTKPPKTQSIEQLVTFPTCPAGSCTFALRMEVKDDHFPLERQDFPNKLSGSRRVVPQIRRITPF